MFSMPKIIFPIVAPDGSIDTHCTPKVVQRVLIAVVGNMSVIVDRDDVSRSGPLFGFALMADFAALTSFRSLFENKLSTVVRYNAYPVS